MTERVVTELVVDGGNANAQLAAFASALKTVQTARERLIGADERAAQIAARQSRDLGMVATSLARASSQWDKLRSSVDPAIDATVRYETVVRRAAATAEQAALKRVSSEREAQRVLERSIALAQRAYEAAGAPRGAAVDPHGGSVGSAKRSAAVFEAEFARLEQVAGLKAAQIAATFGAELDSRLVAGAAKSARDSAAVFEAELSRLDEIGAMKAAQAGAAFRDELNARLVSGTAKSARDSAAVFEAEFARLDDIARMKAEQAGQAFATELNSRLVRGIGKSARDSASVFEAEFNRLDNIARMKAEQAGAEFQRALNERMGIGRQANSAQQSAQVFMELEREAKALDDLKVKYAPVHAAEMARANALSDINKLVAAGKLNEKERTEAVKQVGVAYDNTMAIIKRQSENAARGGRLVSGEIANLSFQLNDVITGIALGQSPFMILAQQGGQVYQIIANSKVAVKDGLGAALKDLGSLALGVINPMVIGFGAIAGAVITATLALGAYGDAQREVARNLSGIGRASGVSRADINNIADERSNAFGLSVSEARQLATALAATGKIGKDSIGPIVELGYQFAKTYGIDAVEANKLLAASFSDPIKGAEDLNQRLGFMDAATQRNIRNLVEQNRVIEAQKILIDGVRSSMANVTDVTSFWSRAWNAVSNFTSNVFDELGRQLSEIGNTGLTLERQLARAQARLADMRAGGASDRNIIGSRGWARSASASEIAEAEAEVRRLTQALQQVSNEAIDAKQKLESIKGNAAIDKLIPERNAKEALDNIATMIEAFVAKADAQGDSSPLLAALGLTRAGLDLARDRARGAADTFLAPFERTIRGLKIQIDAITAFSPTAKGDIAYRQSRLQTAGTGSEAEQKQQAELERTRALREAYVQLSEAQRERLLAAKQSVQTAQLEIDVIGKSVGEQYRMRAELQAEQQLRQEAERNRVPFDKRKLEALKQEIAAEAELRQIQAEKTARERVAFERQTVFFSDTDRQIARELQNLYGDAWQSRMNSALAQQMRLNALLADARDIGGSIASGLLKDLANGMKPAEALLGAMTKIRDILIDILARRAIAAALSSLVGDTGPVAGATTAAGILTVAGAETGASIAAGAATAAGLLTTGGATGGIEAAAGGAAGGGALAAGGITAATAISTALLPLLAAVAAAAAVVYFWDQSNKKKKEQEQAYWDAVVRVINNRERAARALIDENTREGALAAQELTFQRERREEQFKGGLAMVSLLEAQGAERLRLQQEWDRRELEELERHQEELAERRRSYDDRIFATTNDESTLAGALAAFERRAQRDREAELRSGGELIVELEQTLGAERLAILRDFHDQAIEEDRRAAEALTNVARGITDYLLGLQRGNDSPLSPAMRLSAARQAYEATLALAQGGNMDALSRITQDAEAFRSAGESYYGSATGYQDIFSQIQSELSSLPAVTESTDPVVTALADVVAAINAMDGSITGTLTTAVNNVAQYIGSGDTAGLRRLVSEAASYIGSGDTVGLRKLVNDVGIYIGSGDGAGLRRLVSDMAGYIGSGDTAGLRKLVADVGVYVGSGDGAGLRKLVSDMAGYIGSGDTVGLRKLVSDVGGYIGSGDTAGLRKLVSDAATYIGSGDTVGLRRLVSDVSSYIGTGDGAGLRKLVFDMSGYIGSGDTVGLRKLVSDVGAYVGTGDGSGLRKLMADAAAYIGSGDTNGLRKLVSDVGAYIGTGDGTGLRKLVSDAATYIGTGDNAGLRKLVNDVGVYVGSGDNAGLRKLVSDMAGYIGSGDTVGLRRLVDEVGDYIGATDTSGLRRITDDSKVILNAIESEAETQNATLTELKTLNLILTQQFQGQRVDVSGSGSESVQWYYNEALQQWLLRTVTTTGGVLSTAAQFNGATTAANVKVPTPVDNTMLSALNKIVFNTWATAFNTAQMASAFQPSTHPKIYGIYEQGGWVGGNRHSAGGTMINAEQGEFVVNRNAASMLRPFMDGINHGYLPFIAANDNGPVVAELRRLYDRIEQLEQRLVEAQAASANHVRDGVNDVASSIKDGNREASQRAA